jgi:hypothetical protein
MLRKRVDWKSNPAWTILLLSCGASDDVDVGSPGTFTQHQLADAVPLLTESLWLIAEAGDEYVVADVRDVAVDADGNSYVLDGPSVVVIDDAGRFVRRFGGPGPGPGELRSPHAVAVTADTVFIIDNAMLHLFLTGGLLSAIVRASAEPPLDRGCSAHIGRADAHTQALGRSLRDA